MQLTGNLKVTKEQKFFFSRNELSHAPKILLYFAGKNVNPNKIYRFEYPLPLLNLCEILHMKFNENRYIIVIINTFTWICT